MYFQNDYVLRMIEMMGDFMKSLLARVLKLTREDQYERAQGLIDEALRRHAGMDVRMLLALDTATAAGMLSPPRKIAAGELMCIQAQLLLERGDEEGAQACLFRALSLLLMATEGDPTHCAPLYAQVRELDMALPVKGDEMTMGLAAFYEGCGQYALCENLWYDLVQSSDAYRRDALSFYRRLMTRTDEDLHRGNLPRPEIQEGMDRLNA